MCNTCENFKVTRSYNLLAKQICSNMVRMSFVDNAICSSVSSLHTWASIWPTVGQYSFLVCYLYLIICLYFKLIYFKLSLLLSKIIFDTLLFI